MRETTRHREAYAAYLALGAERSIERLHAELAAAGRTPSLRTLYEWSRCFHWQDRLAAFEHRARAAAEEAELEAIREMHARQVTEALLLQPRLGHHLREEGARDVVGEQALAVLREAGGVERLVADVEVEEPLEEQVVAQPLAELALAADRIERDQQARLEQVLGRELGTPGM